MTTFTDNFKKALTLLKQKKGEREAWNGHSSFGNIGFYFSDKDGNIDKYASIRYQEIEVTHYGDEKYKIENIFIEKGYFNHDLWIQMVIDRLNTGVGQGGGDFYSQVSRQLVEKEIRVEVENPIHKAKAGILDNLLAAKNLTN